jgi:predicted transcriptional regulator
MPQQSSKEIEIRRSKVAKLYLEGVRQVEIAGMVGVSEGQISQDLKKLRTIWAKARNTSIDQVVAEELAKIDNLECEYWVAWKKSITDHSKTVNKARGKANAVTPDFQEITEMQIINHGEPRFLNGIERCIERRCKLLGLDAPAKSNVNLGDHSFLYFLMNTS